MECVGLAVGSGKVVPKEVTEDEKAEDTKAKGGKAPAKDAKKAKEEEPTAEELERQEKEKADREEKERRLQEEWDQLDDETKHIRHNEDIFKEPCVKMQNMVAIQKIEELQATLNAIAEDDEDGRSRIQAKIDAIIASTNVGTAVCTFDAYELVELEEHVVNDKGCWLRFMKTIPAVPEAEAGAGKKAPAKGKAAPIDELKPVYGRAWVSFADLLQPGARETKQRVYLETCAPLNKKVHEDGTEEEVEESDYEPIFEDSRTYIHLKLSLSEAITPHIPDKPEPQPNEIVPVKQFVTWPYSKDPCDDFGKQVTLAVESLAKEFFNMFKKQLHEMQTDQKSTEAE